MRLIVNGHQEVGAGKRISRNHTETDKIHAHQNMHQHDTAVLDKAALVSGIWY
jgi:hypothetical protein